VNAASIAFDGVTVRYPGSQRNAVDGVSFELGGGELVVLLGPSGCGKSTLLRTVNRLVTLDEGRVVVDGRDVSEVDPVELRRGIHPCKDGSGRKSRSASTSCWRWSD
jgi:osmoprotectant transport system ATP-binding protein